MGFPGTLCEPCDCLSRLGGLCCDLDRARWVIRSQCASVCLSVTPPPKKSDPLLSPFLSPSFPFPSLPFLSSLPPPSPPLLLLCTHTPCRTDIFLTHFPCVAYRHCVHAWIKVFAVRMSYLPISPSPFSCFSCSSTVTSTLRSCLHLPYRTAPDLKARVKRTSA